ncbi:polysaccharide deacetylase [Desulfovibrio sp. X2]|uniref:polysaccharide deacetylase family protein n=1 Tax=Desulfovibrio sp. X2 TaxID=941449 RepID=UPI0003588536|nr:polysaccharide deacetylase family protein [Desulfovibrio sp. X2]EPR42777.1 polysaccharide deacetylase [Desulfovibrio sp. X2]
MTQSLPVLMYHYVAEPANPIAVHPAIFEEQMRLLSAAGFRGVSLEEAHAFLVRGERLPGRPCLITFDDGYLDNLVYAWPLLEKYGHKGVVFAVTERLAEGPLRPTLRDVWAGRIKASGLPPVNSPFTVDELGLEVRRDLFISREEARAAEASGVLRIEPHGHTHISVFHKPDFHTFFKPSRKKRTFDGIAGRIVWGLPRFAEAPGLATHAYLPSDALYELALREVPQDDREALEFFKDARNEERLKAKVLAVPQEHWGRYETDREYAERVARDLTASVATLREVLGRDPVSIAWPWGAYTNTAREIAQGLGIEMFFCTRAGANPPGAPLAVHRFKARPKAGLWLRSRLEIYSRPWLARLYAVLH